ncbi:response regulator transcription factor [Methylomonas sp. MO1]|uniref:response regulator transcription factor n=1 Tax=Methylomonas sp. MO1 TaxID=3073619 RepID=UPI0028A56BE3|nr:response regulator transcription factor [Methylomonas sp. MO1]MDT4290815.1 response regulator transcription factor [Methylomonas sp. MO1]
MSVIRLLLPPGFAEIGLDPVELEKQGIVVVTMEPNTAEPMNFAALELAMIDGEATLQDNLTLIEQIKSIAPACKFMVLLRHSSAHAVTYMQAGVTGLLAVLPDAVKLAEIIRKLVQGEYYLDQNIAQLLAMRQIKKQLDPFVSLSSREFDVFCLLAEGCSLQTIALQLGISSKTVSNCQTQIKLKLAIDNRGSLRKFANCHGLIIDNSV